MGHLASQLSPVATGGQVQVLGQPGVGGNLLGEISFLKKDKASKEEVRAGPLVLERHT